MVQYIFKIYLKLVGEKSEREKIIIYINLLQRFSIFILFTVKQSVGKRITSGGNCVHRGGGGKRSRGCVV